MLKGIDRVFCITLNTSLDRQKEFRERFPNLIKSNIFEWYITERDSEDTKRGCYNSHRNILTLSKERGYNKIIIFEDDVNLIVTWDKFVEKVNGIKYPDDWKIVQLGCLPAAVVPYNDTVARVICSVLTHSYIVNVNKLTIPEYTGKEIDVMLLCPSFRNYLFNFPVDGMYCVYPEILTRQNSSVSTIQKLRNYQGSLEYDRNALLMVASHINIVLLFFVVSLFIILITGLYIFNKLKKNTHLSN